MNVKLKCLQNAPDLENIFYCDFHLAQAVGDLVQASLCFFEIAPFCTHKTGIRSNRFVQVVLAAVNFFFELDA